MKTRLNHPFLEFHVCFTCNPLVTLVEQISLAKHDRELCSFLNLYSGVLARKGESKLYENNEIVKLSICIKICPNKN